jgi:hypothetical protein
MFTFQATFLPTSTDKPPNRFLEDWQAGIKMSRKVSWAYSICPEAKEKREREREREREEMVCHSRSIQNAFGAKADLLIE